jgi:hypothetical protein
VQPGEDGVDVVCESCASSSPLETEREARDETESPDDSAEIPDIPSKQSIESDLSGDTSTSSTRTDHRNVTSIPEDVVDELVPDPEADRRCPKCATPVASPRREHCADCGLNLEEARSYEEGRAPWEQPDPGREEVFEEARRLWERAVEDHTEEAFEAFVDHVRTHTLFGLGIRKLRFHLVDHPDDEMAVDALRSMASGMEAKMVAARTRAEADAEELQEDISRFKRLMAGVVLVLWVVAMVLFADLFLGWDLL